MPKGKKRPETLKVKKNESTDEPKGTNKPFHQKTQPTFQPGRQECQPMGKGYIRQEGI